MQVKADGVNKLVVLTLYLSPLHPILNYKFFLEAVHLDEQPAYHPERR